MADHHAPCVHPVSLPSIHEMFPAHLMRPKDEYNIRHKYPDAADNHHIPSRNQCSHSPASRPRVPPKGYPYQPPHHNVHESNAHPHTDPRKRSSSHIYSFDALRSDPMKPSPQHLAATATHASSPQQHHHGPSPVASGSGSAFRVSVPPTTGSTGTHMHNPVSIEGRSRALHATPPDPANPAMISFPVSRPPSASKPNQSPPEDASDDDNPGESAGKKHICPTCLKRFNRPSSLRIHVNTHTGATPFRCPWPNCGREFNVNSNMRRHYRNHTTPGFSRAQPNDNRRKRRRVESAPDALSHPMPPVDQAYQRSHHSSNLMPSPPISHFSPSDDSEYDSDMEPEFYSIQEERDELVDYHAKSPPYRSTAGLTQSMARVTVASAKSQRGYSPYSTGPRYQQHHQRQHAYGDSLYARPLTPGSSFHSSSPSNSESPSPRSQPVTVPSAVTIAHNERHSYPHAHMGKREHKYNPSAPYMHSLADTRVSTALRPAFHS